MRFISIHGFTALAIIAVVVCVVLILIASLAVGRRPERARLRRTLVGAGFGGIVAMHLLVLMNEGVINVYFDLADFLVRRGLPRTVFTWSLLYFISGAVFGGMAVGAGVGWWMKREKAK